jgi:CubicO group peptidase (beta-lactamase class C family)
MTRPSAGRLTFAAGLLALVAPLLVATPATAAPAWSTIQSTHGAELQGCKVPIKKGWRLKVRLVNSSDHGHRAGVSVRRDGEIVDRAYFVVVKRRTSKVRSVVWRPGTTLSAGMADADDDGGGGGGTFTLGSIKHC